MAIRRIEHEEVRENLRVLIDSGDAYLIVEEGKPRAIILPVDHYNAMMDAIEQPEDEKARVTASGMMRAIIGQH